MKRVAVTVALLTVLPGCSNEWQRSDLSLARGVVRDPLDRRPAFGATRTADVPPPAISGGTLTVLENGRTAVAADPDRDRVYIVDLEARAVRGSVVLQPGDEPGRVIAGPVTKAFVALRGSGVIAEIDVASPGTQPVRHAACPAPRGIAFHAASDSLYVACAGGELVTLRASTGHRIASTKVTDDLRDVVLVGDRVYVSRFRAADVLQVALDGTIVRRGTPVSTGVSRNGMALAANVAWRLVPAPDSTLLMVHQFSQRATLPVSQEHGAPQGAYGGGGGFGCGGGSVVQSAVTRFRGTDTEKTWLDLPSAAVPVDVAIAPQSGRMVVVAAGNASIGTMPQLYELNANDDPNACGEDRPMPEQPNAQVIAAAFDGMERLIAQTREPAALYLVDQHMAIPLSSESRADTGHNVFHGNSGSGLACASCHPEGGDDGHVWTFDDVGARRTQNLRGGVIGDAPLHWGGELAQLPDLVNETFVRRMSGPALDPGQLAALEHWINTIPIPARVAHAPADRVERGRVLFASAQTACATCHNGPQHTNGTITDVGTGGRFKVAGLQGIALRAPYMHNGCAPTLRDRFTPGCGGGDAHGRTSHLTSSQIDDLVAYMESL